MTLLSLLLVQSTVSVATLLPQMTDLTVLTRPANPPYAMAQASSYDRHSDPGPQQDMFANGDAGQFLRIESIGTRKERVMADLKGPGAVVRIWSANPAGTVRFYFDGEATPRLEAKLADLLTGQVKPFVDPFAYMSARGTNLYFPFPYQKSLKITVDDTDNDASRHLYYHVGYRTYRPTTSVATFDPAGLESQAALIAEVAHQLQNPESIVPAGLRPVHKEATLAASDRLTASSVGPGMVREFTVKIPFPLVHFIKEPTWDEPHQPQSVLRNLVLQIVVDGHETVNTPIGDFFATAPGINVQQTLPFTVKADGTMTCRLPMPCQKQLGITITNRGKVQVPVSVTLKVDPIAPPTDSYALKAQFQQYRGPSRPFRDLDLLNVQGNGTFVGSNLHVSNPTPAWWGEGDEKVYVDGESFPSTFGTGTEDYYGYAWCDPTLFTRPYHAQPRCDGPGNYGHTDVNRWQIVDTIPYTNAIKFQLELWHWEDVPTIFETTTFWYAPATATKPVTAWKDVNVLPIELKPNKPVEGAIEGESLKFTATGGKTSIQSGFWDLSADKQLWWTEPVEGDTLRVEFPVAEAGRYEVFGHFCHATDYGIHDLSIDQNPATRLDFFGEGVKWKKISLGTFDLPKGNSTLTVVCRGKRPEARAGQMFGLDYLILEKR